MRIFPAFGAALLAPFLMLAGPAKAAAPATVAAPATATAAASATADAARLSERLAAVKTAKQINYYPSAAGWTKMWTNFDAKTVDADLAKARSLGADSVRAMLFPTLFGYPTPKPEYTAKLAQFVSIADSHDLSVKFTLFDWWDGYTDTAGSTTWATAVLAPYRYDSRILSIGLQNELDPANTAAITWAKKLVPAVRAAMPSIPLTISVSATNGIADLAKLKSAVALDYYDYHFYGNSERAASIIADAKAAVAPAPLVIGEAGANTLTVTEGEQAAYLARVFEGAKTAGIGSVAPWTLNDFASGAIPESAVGKVPAQYTYGLYRTDGSAKPAAAVVKAAWTGTAYPATVLDPGFENTAAQSPWTAFMPELGVPARTQAMARSGTWSVAMSRTGKTSAGVPSYRLAPLTPVAAGQKWHAEVYARGNAATGTSQIALSWFDAKDKWLGGASSAALPTGTTGWTKLSVDATAPAGSASLQVHLKSGANTGTVWFDDVAMTQSR